MPFQEPLAVENPAFPNTEQPTINIGHIGGAINVQGGGEVLLDENINLPDFPGTTLLVEAPPSGITYYGLAIILTNDGKITDDDCPFSCRVYSFGFELPGIKFQAGLMLDGGSLQISSFGHPETTSVILPVATKFPITITLDHTSVTNMDCHITVIGMSQADVSPRDFGMWELGDEPRVVFNDAADESYAIIAASFERREFLFTTSASAGGDILVDVLRDDGTWTISQTRAHNSFYGGKLTAAATVAETNSLITIPGNGAIHRVRNGTTLVGTNSSLCYLGKK